MNILHVAKTFVAGVPIRMTHFMNKYASNKLQVKCVLQKPESIPFKDHKNIYWYKPGEYSEELDLLMEWADIIHIHNFPPLSQNSPGWQKLKKKTVILQLHSEPNRCKGLYNGLLSYKVNLARILCIAQYQAVFIKEPKIDNIVRNVIDINDQLLKPVYKLCSKPLITYSPSNTLNLEKIRSKKLGDWMYKSYTEVKSFFKKYGDEYKLFNYRIITKTPYEKHLKLKQDANIHIDEFSSGSYHLSSLEGLSQGTIVIANIANWMKDLLQKKLEIPELPWIIANNKNYISVFQSLLKQNLIAKQKESRKWMEKYWNPEIVLNDYMRIYSKL